MHAGCPSRVGPPQIEETPPFLAEYKGKSWVLCGGLDKAAPRSGWLKAANDQGHSVGPESLFQQILGMIDPEDIERSLAEFCVDRESATDREFLLMTSEMVVAVPGCRTPEDPLRDGSLWEGRGPYLQIVASEPIDDIGCETWNQVSEPEIFALRVARLPVRV